MVQGSPGVLRLHLPDSDLPLLRLQLSAAVPGLRRVNNDINLLLLFVIDLRFDHYTAATAMLL